MTLFIQSLGEVADRYDAIVFDQWGVLHDGSRPYPGAVACLEALSDSDHRLAVLSNSGKRSLSNLERISNMGFRPDLLEFVMTSGEALWLDIKNDKINETRLFPIERAKGDADGWSGGIDIEFTISLEDAEAILLMGLPDGNTIEDWRDLLSKARQTGLPLYCSNPDIASPRADGLVVSPGALAHEYQDQGGTVRFYGKPHRPVFDALKSKLGADRLLMVGDSLDHDIAGAHFAGWDSVLVQGGLHADDFKASSRKQTLERLVREKNCPQPTYTIGTLQ
ncbi:MAG: TIGR01459 family HAD-type hydrolase [Pseudomonadota bacterium]